MTKNEINRELKAKYAKMFMAMSTDYLMGGITWETYVSNAEIAVKQMAALEAVKEGDMGERFSVFNNGNGWRIEFAFQGAVRVLTVDEAEELKTTLKSAIEKVQAYEALHGEEQTVTRQEAIKISNETLARAESERLPRTTYYIGDQVIDEDGNKGIVVIRWDDGDICEYENDAAHPNPKLLHGEKEQTDYEQLPNIPKGCNVYAWSNRICEKGTKSCIVQHDREYCVCGKPLGHIEPCPTDGKPHDDEWERWVERMPYWGDGDINTWDQWQMAFKDWFREMPRGK